MADVARKRRCALIGDYRIARVQKYQTQIAIGERSSVLHGNEDEAFWTEFRGWPEAESPGGSQDLPHHLPRVPTDQRIIGLIMRRSDRCRSLSIYFCGG